MNRVKRLNLYLCLLKAPLMMIRLMRNQRLKPPELRELQNKKLRAIIKHSYNHVPYYHHLFKEAKIKPSDIKSIDDLNKIPISKKEHIVNLPLEKLIATNINLNNCMTLRTSGTTGNPLSLYWEIKARLTFFLQHYRWQLECGDKITNKHVVIGARWVPVHPFQKIGIFETKRISNFENIETQIEEIKKFKPDTLIAYPSCVRILAKEAKEKGEEIKLSLIFTSGEILDEHTRKLARDVLNAEIFDGYGANEVGGVCTECVKHEGYHIWSDSVIVEITRDGEPVSTGERGEITATNLTNYAMPFIRYNVEDLGILIENECSCGSPFPLMKITEGRKSDIVQLPDGKAISALSVYSCLLPIQGIKQFQMTQEKTDRFTVKIVKDSKFTDTTIEEVKQTLKQRLGDVEVEVFVVDNIPKEKSGKFRQFITKVPCQP